MIEPASSTLRVLHVVAPADFGGLERVVHALARGQRDRGHSTRVLAVLDEGRGVDHPVVEQLVSDGLDVETIALPPRAYVAERRALRSALARFRPHIVHTHGARVDVLDAPVARRAGFRTVTTIHGFTGGGPKNRLYEYLQRRAIRRADAVVAVSAPLAADLVKSGVPAERVHTIVNAWTSDLQCMSRAQARRQLGIGPDTGVVLGWVGRLTREKGADIFLEAVARLQDLDLRAVVIGSGGEREALDGLVREYGIHDRVHWAGSVERAEPVFPAFDLFILSSRTEGTPIVLFEAMSTGVPVIATAVGGVPDVVSGREAILVPSEDVGALAEGIRRALADPAGMRSRASAAHARLASAFDAQSWLDRYERIYGDLRRTDIRR